MDTRPDTLNQLARPHRKAVLISLLWITIAGGLLFGWLNFQRGAMPIALVELVMTAYSGIILLAIRRTRHLERWILAYLIPFFTAMMVAITTPRASISVFGWVLLIPLVGHLLLGRRGGLIISLVYMGLAAVIFLVMHHDQPAMMDARSLANMIVLALCILVFSHVFEVSRERSESRLLQMAQTDFLTGLPNRSRMKMFFESEKSRALREGQALTLIVIDLDHFKRINDDMGHEAGDRALVYFADILQRRLRATDLAGRLGGEEFGVILVNTGKARALEVAEDLRQALERGSPGHLQAEQPLTLSAGIAEFGPDGKSLQELLAAADRRLYGAKASGRNRVVIEDPVAEGETAGTPAPA